jgi:hypothetical protein
VEVVVTIWTQIGFGDAHTATHMDMDGLAVMWFSILISTLDLEFN